MTFRVQTGEQERRGDLLRGSESLEHQEREVRGHQVHEEPLQHDRTGEQPPRDPGPAETVTVAEHR